MWSEKIVTAISSSSPTVSDLARILLLIGESTGIGWPKEMLSRLRELTKEN